MVTRVGNQAVRGWKDGRKLVVRLLFQPGWLLFFLSGEPFSRGVRPGRGGTATLLAAIAAAWRHFADSQRFQAGPVLMPRCPRDPTETRQSRAEQLRSPAATVFRGAWGGLVCCGGGGGSRTTPGPVTWQLGKVLTNPRAEPQPGPCPSRCATATAPISLAGSQGSCDS